MLDKQMMEQLKSVFAHLDNEITLVISSSDHEKQSELLQMLNELSKASSQIKIEQNGKISSCPHFYIEKNKKKTGISFTGVPGGHEFSSLVLAILNASGQGKLPDQGIVSRIQNLKGPIRLKTYISLSCENCPEVVQALNLMALFHPDMEHEMVDGGVATEQAESLNLQGVPSVVVEGKKLLSAGKISLLGLLEKLEAHFGKLRDSVEARELGHYDVVVIGAGPAGASAAIYTKRKGLKTLVIAEKMGGQVQDTKGIENMISIPYVEGPQLSANLAQHMAEYDTEFLQHRRVSQVIPLEPPKEGHLLKLDSGESLTTRSLIVATGAQWRELGIPGEKEYLGHGVAFCPHCDGPYYKGKDIAVVGGGNSGVEAAIDLAGIVKSVTLIEFAEELKADEVLVKKLMSLPNVSVIKNAQTTQVLGDGEKVTHLEYRDRGSDELHSLSLAGVFVQIGLVPNSAFIKDVVETNPNGEITVDSHGRTNIRGIYAAGDVTTVPYKQIVIAMGEGAKTALTAFEDTML
jgi:alkyl hydroperoxide reductase subunit F